MMQFKNKLRRSQKSLLLKMFMKSSKFSNKRKVMECPKNDTEILKYLNIIYNYKLFNEILRNINNLVTLELHRGLKINTWKY